VAIARGHRDFFVIARSVSDEAIQQGCTEASSKRRTLNCFTAVRNDEVEGGADYFSIIARRIAARRSQGGSVTSSSLRGAKATKQSSKNVQRLPQKGGRWIASLPVIARSVSDAAIAMTR
jgi:hypothetical protein